MRSQSTIAIAFVGLFLAAGSYEALAHGGGLDKCGGHKDKKRGGYHVHNMVKWCSCNPSADECKKPVASPKATK